MKANILVIDDEINICSSLKGILSDAGYQVEISRNGIEALEIIRNSVFDLVLLDIFMYGIDGIETLKEIKSIDPKLPIIIISGHGNSEIIRQVIKFGAYAFINKPLSLDIVLNYVYNALVLKKLKEENEKFKNLLEEKEMVISKKLKEEVFSKLKEIKSNNNNVLIIGEKGVGKRLSGFLIYKHISALSFSVLNCQNFSENALELKLFGYEKGAFVEAKNRHRGELELNQNGILFLNEIDSIPLPLQEKLLYTIKKKVFQRIGGLEPINLETKIIFSTTFDIRKNLQIGKLKFNETNTTVIYIPSLKERKEEISNLSKYFIKQICEKEGIFKKEISDEGIEILKKYHWTGNVKELKNIIERLVITSEEKNIGVKQFSNINFNAK
ncbi:MAG: sigma-54 dependent transcriptional regulator [bacterium]